MAVVATGLVVGTGSLSGVVDRAAGDTSSLTSAAPAHNGSGSAAREPAGGNVGRTGATTTDSEDSTSGQGSVSPSNDRAAQAAAQEAADAAAARARTVSRSASRTDSSSSTLKADALSFGQGNTLARSENLSDQAPQVIAQALLSDYGWSQDQFGCLDSLWTRESGWNVHADNPSSSAYGIPQALPGSKMASAGSDWENNPVTQIKWGLGYIADRYGSPCGAWAHSESSGFY